jgi:hypothetical protein
MKRTDTRAGQRVTKKKAAAAKKGNAKRTTRPRQQALA